MVATSACTSSNSARGPLHSMMPTPLAAAAGDMNTGACRNACPAAASRAPRAAVSLGAVVL